MKEYCVLDPMQTIVNIIVCENDEIAAEFGAVPYYHGAKIGDPYSPPPSDKERSKKEAELSAACNAAIVAGMDVATTQGTEHFSLQETDQINLTTAYNAVVSGVPQYPYHADGKLCRMFSADEIKSISDASIQHKMYHTTLCNHLMTWARRAETEEELSSITYTAEGLPEDLAQNMTQIMTEAQNV